MAPVFLNAIFSLPPYHLVSWGSLLGMELYQSFVMTKICFLYLPRPQFTTLQKRVFPLYFSLQLGLVVLTVITYPPGSLFSLVQLARWGDLVPLALNAAMAALNAGVYGPRTQMFMVDRIHQETRDGRKQINDQGQDRDSGAVSEEMRRLRRSFSKNHAMAIHLNAIAMIATVCYGFSLASRIQMTV